MGAIVLKSAGDFRLLDHYKLVLQFLEYQLPSREVIHEMHLCSHSDFFSDSN